MKIRADLSAGFDDIIDAFSAQKLAPIYPPFSIFQASKLASKTVHLGVLFQAISAYAAAPKNASVNEPISARFARVFEAEFGEKKRGL